MSTTALHPDSDGAREQLIARGWDALPASYRIPEKVPTLDEARAWCQHLAETHYENFHVATWFLPKKLRPHFHAIYAYCRVSDDLGDETGDTAQSLALLDLWGRELDACYEGRARHPVFVALTATIRACSIPKEPFADLLNAFKQDQVVKALRDDAGRAWVLSVLRPILPSGDWFCTPAGMRTRNGSNYQMRRARPCSSPTSGRTYG